MSDNQSEPYQIVRNFLLSMAPGTAIVLGVALAVKFSPLREDSLLAGFMMFVALSAVGLSYATLEIKRLEADS